MYLCYHEDIQKNCCIVNPNLVGYDDGQVQFVMVKEANKVRFGVKESNERLYWLQWLIRATGQSHKPSPPDATPNSEGYLTLVMHVHYQEVIFYALLVVLFCTARVFYTIRVWYIPYTHMVCTICV